MSSGRPPIRVSSLAWNRLIRTISPASGGASLLNTTIMRAVMPAVANRMMLSCLTAVPAMTIVPGSTAYRLKPVSTP